MHRKKQVCDFGMKQFNQIKRSDVQRAPRPKGGGHQGGKPPKGDVTAPTISNITVSDMTDNTVTIDWTTNEQTISLVQYGTTTSYGSTANSSSSGTTTHSAVLINLVPDTAYHFRIKATDLAGNIAYSIDDNFGTEADPVNLIYLEFYGATVTNTLWNTQGSIIATHSGFTQAEIDVILARVQEGFADFNVLVTIDKNLYDNTATDRKTWVIFTEYNEWYSSNAGGVAYIGCFGWSNQEPAFVFTKLLYYNTHYVAEAGLHEAGHTLSCEHQVTCNNGVITSSYNWGDGTYAPIMGASYNVAAGDWWVGPTPYGCNVIQDDSAVIAAVVGLKA